jgi:uncharacterized Zn finger protein
MRYNFPRSGSRRPARDGIRARSRRGQIGESWWAGRFIDALEKLTEPGRQQRGRSYARSGQVLGLEVAPGAVTARVQGSESAPYQVEIALQPLTPAQWAAVEQAMADQAIFLAALLAGEMPRQIEETFTEAGVSLFPTTASAFTSTCSCPDLENPCKHAAAVVYLLAEQFDEDPFQIFAWRGREKDELLARLRALRADTAQDVPALPAQDAAGGAGSAAAAADPPLDVVLHDFWRAGADFEQSPAAPQAAEVPDALLRQLGLIGLDVRGTEVTTVLAPVYRVLTAAAVRRARGQRGGEDR